MKLKALALSIIAASSLASVNASAGVQPSTKHPVIFAHGMVGYDSLVGGTALTSYFGDDWLGIPTGVYVGKACTGAWFETCNKYISGNQRSNAFRTSFLNNSDVRGDQLRHYVRTYCAATTNPSTGASVCNVGGVSRVNMVGHSQGGFDIRKAAKLLKQDGISTGALVSISSPHRGARMAKAVLDKLGGATAPITSIADWMVGATPLANGTDSYGNTVTLPQDTKSAAFGLVDVDYDPNDGITTGTQNFNARFPGTGDAQYLASIVTGQDNLNKNPALLLMGALPGFSPDDGLVDTNSQQMGTRLRYSAGYTTCTWYLKCDYINANFSPVGSTGSVTNLNAPSTVQRDSKDGVLDQDHFDVMGYGPDTLDEHEMYAALMAHIASKGY
jgi:triacylglycerol lipase